jgi:SAM-dependent methyltransferase
MSLLDDYLYIAHAIDRSMAKQFCPRLRGEVLDVGCGTRPYAPFLTNASRYVGMDSNPDVNPDVIGSVLELPFEPHSFDAVLCNEVLEHVPDPARALREVNRVLRDNGTVYVTVPQSWGLHYEPHDYFRFTRYGISHLLVEAGFTVDDVRQMGGLFSYFAVRVIDLVVLGALFPLLARLGLRRGNYRIAALLVLPLNALLSPVVSMLDRRDRVNAYGWAVVARKRPSSPDG